MLAGLTEFGVYTAHAAVESGGYWYVFAEDDHGHRGSVAAVASLPTERDTLVVESHRTRFRIAIDYDPAAVAVIG